MGAGVTCQLVLPQQLLRELLCPGNLRQAASVLEGGASLRCCIRCFLPGLCRYAPGIACLSKSVLTLLIATLAVALSALRRVAALAIHLCLEGHESLYGRLRDRRDRILHRQQ